MRRLFEKEARIKSTVITEKEQEAVKYKDYFDFSEPVATIPSHRVLAILRGFLEGYLRMSIEPAEEHALAIMEDMYREWV